MKIAFLVIRNKFSANNVAEFIDAIKKYSVNEIREINPNSKGYFEFDLNNYDCICLHPSPLPKYRGGSPIQNQIIRNEKTSAVTIFKMGPGIDDGDIIRQLPMSLSGIIEDIFDRMVELGFAATCDFFENGYKLIKQNHDEATYYKRRKPSDSEITRQELLTETSEYLYNKIRMLTEPYPNAYIVDESGKKLYIIEAFLGQ